MKFVESYYRIIDRDNCYLGIIENVSSNFSLINDALQLNRIEN